MSEKPLPPLGCVPVHDPEPADVCFELHLQRLLTKYVLEQTVASCCLNVMDVTLQEKTKKIPLMYVVLTYSGRMLNGSTHVTQHIVVLRLERSWVFI